MEQNVNGHQHNAAHGHGNSGFWGGIMKSMGLVFGDIGTSPIYTLTVIFALTKPTETNVFGILSLIVWTLILLVTAEYTWLAMSLSKKGEGGTLVLKEILVKLMKGGRAVGVVSVLSFLGISLLMGDGIITPAISILSAIEGVTLIPAFSHVGRETIVITAIAIAVMLFIFQSNGTDKVARAFGPIMVIWFVALAISGGISIAHFPSILKAASPWYAVKFFMENGLAGFFVLSEVILCATGGEAIYADMGHLGRKPIIRAWYFVFGALFLNYLGQGAFLLSHPETKNVLFGMIKNQSEMLYIPFLLLTVLATVIASQALISGVFSIVYQGITTRIMPLLKVEYTSSHMKSQIYIGAINWFMMVMVICVMIVFQKSESLAAAYGLACTGTMTITGTLMTLIFARTTKKWKVPIVMMITLLDATFLIANLNKLPHGGYWSLVLASIPFTIIMVWTTGQRALYKALKPLDMDVFLLSYEQVYAKNRNIPGTGLFFARERSAVPPYVVHCMLRSNILYERNVLITIVRGDDPFGVHIDHIGAVGTGLELFEIHAGYMEVLDVEKILSKHNIVEKAIFYGVEEIATANPLYRAFSIIKTLTPNFVQFNRLPAGKLQGVLTRVELGCCIKGGNGATPRAELEGALAQR